jgi:nucleotide-binding universal stress UspA family protein
MYTHILVPTDGSALSLKAAKAAVELARVMKTKLTAVYATAPWMPPMGGEGELPRHMFTMESDYRKASEKEAEKALAGLLLGSETVKVLTHSKIPVLVCR